MDARGRGEAVYRVDASDHQFRFVVFSTCIDESQRTDRVVAEAWDVAAALTEGAMSDERRGLLRHEVPRQEGGRADEGTLVWTRANRSSRYFDYLVDRLARGLQPEADAIGDASYVLRSTAFYANGKWGLADYERLREGHPLHLPYRAQMLAAFLLRELSYDLVEHCASARSRNAVGLAGSWRRYFGLGNATGLGLVPYVVNHPRILDAWVALRELALAHALGQVVSPATSLSARLANTLGRAVRYFRERTTLRTDPYLPLPELASHLELLLPLVGAYESHGALPAGTSTLPLALHEAAAMLSTEARQVVDTLLVECFPDIDDDVEALLCCDESGKPALAQTCSSLRKQLERDYAWVNAYDFTDRASVERFWFFSEASQEPRRGRRGIDPGHDAEMPLGIARDMHALMRDLDRASPAGTLAEFLLGHPWHRGPIERAQSLAGVPYGEVPANLLDRDFVPLHLQRFQLAVYGAENFSPVSRDWLRVTLFGGAPRGADVAAGVDDDWLFMPKPADSRRAQGAAA